jgi:hypothetical protein
MISETVLARLRLLVVLRGKDKAVQGCHDIIIIKLDLVNRCHSTSTEMTEAENIRASEIVEVGKYHF